MIRPQRLSLPHSFPPSLLFVYSFLFFTAVFAQTSTSSPAASSSENSSSTATVVPGNVAYTYTGCYNETTGENSTGNARALAGGSMVLHRSHLRFCRCLQLCLLKPETNNKGLESIGWHDRRTVLLLLRNFSIRRPRIWTGVLVCATVERTLPKNAGP